MQIFVTVFSFVLTKVVCSPLFKKSKSSTMLAIRIQPRVFAGELRSTGDIEFEPPHITPYNPCRLIPLDKNPCVRLIEVGEVFRRIIGGTFFDASGTISRSWGRIGNSALVKNVASNTPFTVYVRHSSCQRQKGFS